MVKRRLVLVVVLCLLLYSYLLPPSASAYGMAFLGRIDTGSFLNMSPIGAVGVVANLTMYEDEPATLTELTVILGGVTFDESAVVEPGESRRFETVANFTPEVLSACDGTIAMEVVLGQTLDDGTWKWVLGWTETFPCSIAPPIVVTPIPPSQTEVCGPSNDLTIVPQQPTGVLSSESSWQGGVKVVEFSAADNYVLSGEVQSSFQFVDVNSACQTDSTPTTSPQPSPTATPGSTSPTSAPQATIEASPTIVPTSGASPEPTASDNPTVGEPTLQAHESAAGVVTTLPNTGRVGASSPLAVLIVAICALGIASVAILRAANERGRR